MSNRNPNLKSSGKPLPGPKSRPALWLLLLLLGLSVVALSASAGESAEPEAEASTTEAPRAEVAPEEPTEAGNETTAESEPEEPVDPDSMLTAVPEGLASFGAAVSGDHLYVYGGHIGRTHQHSIQNLSTQFLRLDLTDSKATWEDLGEVEGLQGLALVAHGDDVCRIGGLSALNAKGEDEDLLSVDSAQCFDTKTKVWRDLPPLPAPRSSHDAVVLDGHIYVVGGWGLFGKDGGDSLWYDQMAVLDLDTEGADWQLVNQPFERRALAVAAAAGRLATFGGIDRDGTSRAAEAFDPATQSWTTLGPVPEEGGLQGFGVSAIGVGDWIALSGGSGKLHLLDAAGAWTTTEQTLRIPRFFHRLVAHGDRLVALAGASMKSPYHLTDVEVLGMPARVTGGGAHTASWSGFRGAGDGATEAAGLPVAWSDNEGIAWRATLAGFGQSAPVVSGDRIFVTSTEGTHKETLVLSALALADGETLWQQRFDASQKIEASDMVSQSAPTPVVDGAGRLFAFWESGDVLGLDAETGSVLWQRSLTQEFGDFQGNHGVASSPVLAGDALVVQVTHSGPSYLIALDLATGETHWKTDRPSKVSWTTPAVAQHEGREVLLVSAGGRVEALDATDGAVLWQLDGVEKNHVPSPVLDGDLVIVASSAAGHNQALALDGASTETPAVAWRAEGVSSGFGSPVVAGGCVLLVNKAGVATCIDRDSGAERWKHRLAESTWASPIRAGERVYFFTKEGATNVLQPDREGPHPLAENPLTVESTVYGAAATDGALLLRTGRELIRVGASS